MARQMSEADHTHPTYNASPEASQPGAALIDAVPLPTQRPLITEYKPSYYTTPWPIVNSLLAIVEQRTGGKAGVLQRLFTFLLFGGTAALVNLGIFKLMLLAPLPLPDKAHNLVAYLIASELSIIANFIPNDRITFSHLPGANRPWLQRCIRFHATNIGGVILTYALQFVFHYALNLDALIAEALAIIIVLFYNFSVHHLFTYRAAKTH